ncbi:MAG: hypothetical protein GOVbin1096_58 [Prokaryotic dsDNA virus sp.]|jgi:hypothetical protein|nr:MAG: hypothetical protein GOVbin1096_58 [Prokaryotic dsDNA virus sp.]|tara:strand:- start:78510 stop:79964 length:1455 start_codon:yes stop_codon:yes gene_type:complete
MIEQTPIVTYVGELNPYDEVDYFSQAQDLTTTQFKGRDVFNRYLQLMLAGRVELQQTIKDLMQKRSLETAEGEQLDVLGRILGQERQLFDSVIIRYFGFDGATGASPYKSVNDTERTYGPWKGTRDTLLGVRELTDAEYRRILRLKIIKNTSDANITAFNDGVRILFGIDNVDYQEITPAQYSEGAATITISIGRDYNDPEKAAFPGLDEIALANRFLNTPLGVGTAYQNPITMYANFVTQNYEQFVFGEDGLSIVPFDYMFDFSRPYTADYYDSSGTLQTAAIDEPRFTHDQTTNEPLGLLIEGPNEVLTHTWGLELNDTQGTMRVVLEHFNSAATEVAMVTEGNDFKIVLFRDNTYWKVRVEYDTTESYEMIIPQYAANDRIIANISYTPKSVFFRIEDEDRYTTIEVPFDGMNARGFDLRFGGEFTTNVGDTYGHFNGRLEEFIYLRPYIGDNQDAVVDGMAINTEDYNKILTEFDETILT